MGCDIHLFTERKRTINDKKIWVSIDHFKINPYHKSDTGAMKYDLVSVYNQRNYEVFSMLANVRNGGENTVISEPRGIPKDCSEETLKYNEYWDSDGHSHSHLSLKELKQFRNDNRITKYNGLMDHSNASLVDSGKMPNEWCGGTNNKSYVYREWEHESDTLKDIVNAIQKRKEEEFWIFDNEEHAEFDEEIRIVFWFDN